MMNYVETVDEKLKTILENEFKIRQTAVLSIKDLKQAVKKRSNHLAAKQRIAGNGFVEFFDASNYFGRPLAVWPNVRYYPDGDKFETEIREEQRIRNENLMTPIIFNFVTNVFFILGHEKKLPIPFFEFLLSKQYTAQFLGDLFKSLETHFRNVNYLYYIVEDAFVSLLGNQNLIKILMEINFILRNSTNTNIGPLENLHRIFVKRMDGLLLAEQRIEFASLLCLRNFKTFIEFYPSVFRLDDETVFSVCPVLNFEPGFPLEPEPIRNAYLEWTQILLSNNQAYYIQQNLQNSLNFQSVQPLLTQNNVQLVEKRNINNNKLSPDIFTRTPLRDEIVQTLTNSSFESEVINISNGFAPIIQPNLPRPAENVLVRMPFDDALQINSYLTRNDNPRPILPMNQGPLQQMSVQPILQQNLAYNKSNYWSSSQTEPERSSITSMLSRTRSSLSVSLHEEATVSSTSMSKSFSWDDDTDSIPIGLPVPLKPLRSP